MTLADGTQALTGDRKGPSAAAAALEELFSSAGKKGGGSQQRLTVLLVDEMDLLVTRRQSVSPPPHYSLVLWQPLCMSIESTPGLRMGLILTASRAFMAVDLSLVAAASLLLCF